MVDKEIEEMIISRLYEHRFLETGTNNLTELMNAHVWNASSFERTVDWLSHKEYIRARAMGGIYSITANGVDYAEGLGISPAELTTQNKLIRYKVLDTLAEVYEREGQYIAKSYQELAANLRFDPELVVQNLVFTKEFGFVKSWGAGAFSITQDGIEAVRELEPWWNLSNDFANISRMEPTARGRAFQKLFARLVGLYGWEQET